MSDIEVEVFLDRVLLSWESEDPDVTEFRVKQDNELIGVVPREVPLFEFPFSNESLTEDVIVLSGIVHYEFEVPTVEKTQYAFSLNQIKNDLEEVLDSKNVYYEGYLNLLDFEMIPNPCKTGENLTIAASLESGINSTIT